MSYIWAQTYRKWGNRTKAELISADSYDNFVKRLPTINPKLYHARENTTVY